MNSKSTTHKDRPEIEIFEELCLVLKKFSYRGISFDKIIKANFINDYWEGTFTEKKLSKRSILLTRLRLLIKIIILNIKKNGNIPDLNDTVLIETLSIESRLRGFWQPLTNAKCKLKFVLTYCGNIEQENTRSLPVLTPKFLKVKALSVFYWHVKNSSVLIKEIDTIAVNNNLSKLSSQIIYDTILNSVIIIDQYSHLFKENLPIGYITIDDQQLQASIICNILNTYNVPTFTFVHGAIGSKSMSYFTPLNSKYVFTWGTVMNRFYIDCGISSDRILTVGCQRSSAVQKFSMNDTALIKNKIGISLGSDYKPIILLGFTRLITEKWIDNLKYLKNKLAGKYVLICRLHPSLSKKDLIKYGLESSSDFLISESKDIDMDKLISVSDFVAVESSTIGFDALLHNKPVFVLESEKGFFYHAVLYDAILADAIIHCETADELVEKISGNLDMDILNANMNKFIYDYIKYYDQDAVDNIIKELEAKIFLN